MGDLEMTMLIGMKRIRMEIELRWTVHPALEMVNQRQTALLCDVPNDLRQFWNASPAFVEVAQYGQWCLEDRQRMNHLESVDELVKLAAEDIRRDTFAIVGANHHERNSRHKRLRAPIEIIQEVGACEARVGAVQHEIFPALHLPYDSFAENFCEIAPSERMLGTMSDAVTIEQPTRTGFACQDTLYSFHGALLRRLVVVACVNPAVDIDFGNTR